ncbi:MAG: hypothetical protein LUC24_02980 [Bacteroidales bacterium]|nr:hypothetical protein [Bacteroidales bacterium]
MRKIFFSAAALTMIVAAACNKEPDSVTSVAEVDSPKGELVTLSLGVSCGSTRSVDALDEEQEVSYIQAFIFDSNGNYEASGNSHSGHPDIEVSTGDKIIVACVNAEYIDPSNIAVIKDLREQVTYLKDNSAGNFIMYGEKTETVDQSVKVVVEVGRMVARVAVRKITNGIDKERYFDNLTIKRIFIINVAGDAQFSPSGTYSPTLWYNASVLMEDNLPELLCSEELDYPMRSGETYDEVHYFYCYPNPTEDDVVVQKPGIWLPRYTRLAVEAELNGKTYYYPVSLPDIKSNYSFEVTNFTITGAGTTSPDTFVFEAQTIIEVESKKWDNDGDVTPAVPNR